ncbi:ABC transporter ATP-binding protein [Plantactinospora sp. CA-290183]|uniref:ABC transporter ATP-binding protein n=1 Tax=Plantactinospora sp. CA-290183 TaxID=3240006 RepID=UPI003D928DA0
MATSILLRTVTELSPAGVALASGHVVATLAGPRSDTRALLAVLILGGILLIGQAAEALQAFFTTVITQTVNGALRHRLRTLAMASGDLRVIEDPAFQDDAGQAGDLGMHNGRFRSPGAAAVGQVGLLLRMIGGLTAAAIVARFSVPLAVALLTIILMVRVLLRRHWMRLAEINHLGDGRRRRALYWTSLATEPPAAKELRVFDLGYWLMRRYQRDEIAGIAPTWRMVFRTLRLQTPVIILSALAATLALGVPGYAAVYGQISSSTLVTCVFAAWAIFGLGTLGSEVFDIEYGGITVRAHDQLVRRHRHGQIASPVVAQPAAGERPPVVRFENVTFRYPGGSRPVLDGLTLDLRPGAVTALVGHNGAGKTTLIKLLAGLYRPSAGQITVDGASLADLDPRAWRRNLAVLFQDFVQYPESVHMNVVAGAPEARDDTSGALTAISRAGLAELVEKLPNGLDTPLWSGVPGGVDLSGGQWQRLALARVLFAVQHGRRIVILDEPTAHLEPAVEAEFHQQIVAAMPGTTVVLISHRLSTVRHAHNILLLSDGKITEAGDHEQLMALQCEYARLYRLQAERFVGSAGGK